MPPLPFFHGFQSLDGHFSFLFSTANLATGDRQAELAASCLLATLACAASSVAACVDSTSNERVHGIAKKEEVGIGSFVVK